MKKLVLFDFDGTLADTSEGIINSHKYAHEQMLRKIPGEDVLYGVIGGPLLKTYIDKFCFNEADAVKAVKIYRDYYARQGINEACLYDGMSDLLSSLKKDGFKLGIATLKAESFAIKMADILGIKQYFDVIHGVDGDDKLTKSLIIDKCISDLHLTPDVTIMVGDSIHDYNGANESNVDFIGVSYGFGFTKDDTDLNLCKNTQELFKKIVNY